MFIVKCFTKSPLSKVLNILSLKFSILFTYGKRIENIHKVCKEINMTH